MNYLLLCISYFCVSCFAWSCCSDSDASDALCETTLYIPGTEDPRFQLVDRPPTQKEQTVALQLELADDFCVIPCSNPHIPIRRSTPYPDEHQKQLPQSLSMSHSSTTLPICITPDKLVELAKQRKELDLSLTHQIKEQRTPTPSIASPSTVQALAVLMQSAPSSEKTNRTATPETHVQRAVSPDRAKPSHPYTPAPSQLTIDSNGAGANVQPQDPQEPPATPNCLRCLCKCLLPKKSNRKTQ